MKTLIIIVLSFILFSCDRAPRKMGPYSATTNIRTINGMSPISSGEMIVPASLYAHEKLQEAIRRQAFELGYFIALKNVQEEKIHVFDVKEIYHQYHIDSLWAAKQFKI